MIGLLSPIISTHHTTSHDFRYEVDEVKERITAVTISSDGNVMHVPHNIYKVGDHFNIIYYQLRNINTVQLLLFGSLVYSKYFHHPSLVHYDDLI